MVDNPTTRIPASASASASASQNKIINRLHSVPHLKYKMKELCLMLPLQPASVPVLPSGYDNAEYLSEVMVMMMVVMVMVMVVVMMVMVMVMLVVMVAIA